MHFSPLLLHTPGLFFSPAVFVLSLPPVIAGSPLLIVIPRFFFFFVIPQLFFFFVIPRLDRGICKGDVRLKAEHDRKRKEAEHDKENTRHGLTICTQKATRFNKGSRRSQRALKGVPLSSWLQLALYVFLKTSESESYSKKQGENFLIVQQKYVSIYFTR